MRMTVVTRLPKKGCCSMAKHALMKDEQTNDGDGDDVAEEDEDGADWERRAVGDLAASVSRVSSNAASRIMEGLRERDVPRPSSLSERRSEMALRMALPSDLSASSLMSKSMVRARVPFGASASDMLLALLSLIVVELQVEPMQQLHSALLLLLLIFRLLLQILNASNRLF